MAQLSVGEDLFSTLVAVGLLSVFVFALIHTYQAHSAHGESQEDFELALDVAEQLKNDVLSGSGGGPRPGIITQAEFERELPRFSELLARRGVGLRVEVKSLEGEPLFSYGPEPANHSSSVSLPVALERSPGVRRLSQLVVWVWGD